MIVAEMKVVPIGAGSSMKKAMLEIVDTLEKAGITYEMGPLATTMEAEDLQTILDAVSAVHGRLIKEVPRVEIELSIDHRVDKEETAESLVKDVGEAATTRSS